MLTRAEPLVDPAAAVTMKLPSPSPARKTPSLSMLPPVAFQATAPTPTSLPYWSRPFTTNVSFFARLNADLGWRDHQRRENRGPFLELLIGLGGLLGDDVHIVGDFHLNWIEAPRIYERFVVASAGLADVGKQTGFDSSHDDGFDGFGIKQPGKLRRCEKGISHGLRAPFLESWGPVSHEEVRAGVFLNLAVLPQSIQDKSDPRFGLTGVNRAEINHPHLIILAQQNQVLVSPPDGLLQIALGLPHVFC